MINSPVTKKKGKNLGPVTPEIWPHGTLCRYTWVYQKVPRLSSTDRKQMALGEYLRYD